MAKEKYILFSDGDVTSFGEFVGKDSESGKYLVKNPAYIGFERVTVADESSENEGLAKIRYQLKAHFAPYVPTSAIVKGDNTWKVTAKHVLDLDTEFHEGLIADYKAQIHAIPVTK